MSDELLLDKVNVACANETEHQNKKKLLSHQHPTKVNPVQVNEVAVEKKAKTQCHKNTEKLEPDVRVTYNIYIYIYRSAEVGPLDSGCHHLGVPISRRAVPPGDAFSYALVHCASIADYL